MNDNYDKFLKLKSDSGLHSPSVFELKNDLNIDIKIDACFLCNPYAFDLFIENFKKIDLTDYIKYYPPQNKILSNILSKSININPEYLLIGNGAIQLIELIMREFENKKKCIITPTFSTYYEYDFENIVFFKTYKENNFNIDKKKLVEFCQENNVEVLIIVNPNNPTGTIVKKNDLKYIIKELKTVSIVVDESFIDFYDKSHSVETEVYNNKNLIVIRSLSKDFGIAGLRLGYSVCNPKLNDKIFSKYGLCWNINGLAQIFLELMSNVKFKDNYQLARKKYLDNREKFFNNLQSLEKFKVYKSHANFFIIDCYEHINTVFSHLLFEKKIYTRILNDKLDLDDSFLRVACGTEEDNFKVFEALKEINDKL
jgi:histidinol-phosphate/aromatic aminotransferase/cobyric acid decarboxylase-like protein